ncbi:MAG: ATP-dependent RNA helicase HrpA [Verrucomicrobiota bacterium]
MTRLEPRYSGDLPIHARREEIIRTVRDHQVVVIAGETGSGKTTQIPKMLLDCGIGNKGLIGCTQPRRVAALSVAQRIAEELQVNFGQEVGAKIRFTDQTSKQTAIKVMTDGILLNELQDDPELRAYEAIVIDEAHERSLNIDFILGCLRQLMNRRKDLKIIITSATIDTETFSKAFDDAPVIEVSGRMYPVDTFYRPVDEIIGEEKDISFIEAAARIVEEIVDGNQAGDVLVFLPGERDIYELRDCLENSSARTCQILPLFGRMANADQQNIFRPGSRRRIILSTNIAETSLTVPGIRYVVDTGLARVSRYSPHTRTQRLPIEPIAQSSADQRKGRCGRVSNGVCYRLYSEQDFLSRPRFTTPEIHRSNLASVILRMLAFHLGEIESFPFIEPPTENAISGGYRLLVELDAVRKAPDSGIYKLTKLGRRLAKLPVDPTVARMLLQAKEENALDEVLVIASGLSIQDPRERPADKVKEADEVQRAFNHPDSDFLSLLNIWNAYHQQMDALSQGQLRKFCKRHYLAYQRMREWRDIYHQLERILIDLRLLDSKRQRKTGDGRTQASYQAIHCSILAGLLSNIATKEEEHIYRGPRNRKAMLFPGSALFDHETAKKQRKAAYASKTKVKPAKTSAPDWIVCGEWMETSRLFARTAAKVEAEWIESIAGNLMQIRHSEPFWSSKAAAVLCTQRKILFGLEIAQTKVNYSRIKPDVATEIFIRNGLIEKGIRESPDFIKHNEAIREEATSEIARLRLGSELVVEDRLFNFYHDRIQACGSYADLRSFAKTRHGGHLHFLEVRLDDLLPEKQDCKTHQKFPKYLNVGGSPIELSYRQAPGQPDDGVTLHVSLQQFEALQQSMLDWAVPGYLTEQVEQRLRSLPKPMRIQLHPLKERAVEITSKLEANSDTLSLNLFKILREEYNILTDHSDWNEPNISDHLKPRIQIEDTKGNTIAEGRNLEILQKQVFRRVESTKKGQDLKSIPAWNEAATRIERKDLQSSEFGDLPESIDLSGPTGLPLKAYPALTTKEGRVDLRLLSALRLAEESTREAWPVLGEICLGREAGWLHRELKELKQIGPALLPLGNFEKIKADAWLHLRRYLFRCDQLLPLKESKFKAVMQRADQERRGLVTQFIQTLSKLLETRQEVELVLQKKKTKTAISFPGMREQLNSLVPEDILTKFDFAELSDLNRFLTAMRIRAERAKESVQRDIKKSERIKTFDIQYKDLAEKVGAIQAKPYFLLLEEFKVSIYAQELGTAQKVSEKRLDQLAQKIHRWANDPRST